MQRPASEIANNIQYRLVRNKDNKTLTLHPKNSEMVLARAKFAFDVADAYGILSDIEVMEQGFEIEQKFQQDSTSAKQARVDFMVDQATDYIRQNSPKDSEIFPVIPKAYAQRFYQDERYENHHPRLMILKVQDTKYRYDAPEGVECIRDKALLLGEYLQDIMALLNQAYWRYPNGKYANNMCTEQKAQQLIGEIDDCYMLRKDNKVVAFVRLHGNDDTGYVSDMVVDRGYRGQGLGSYLFAQMYQGSIQGKLRTVVLTRAGQGDGLVAAPKTYSKFGFKHSVQEMNENDTTNYNDLGESVVFMREMKRPQLIARPTEANAVPHLTIRPDNK